MGMNKLVVDKLALAYSTNWLIKGRDRDKDALALHVEDSIAIWTYELANENLPEVLHTQAAENIVALSVAENRLINRKL